MQRNSAYEVPIVSDWSGSVDVSGEEFCLFCIWASEYDREMSMVDPSSFPIYFRLHGCEPWVAENGFVFAEVGEEELEGHGSGSCSNVQDGVVTEVSALVLCPIDVEQFTGFRKLFDRE